MSEPARAFALITCCLLIVTALPPGAAAQPAGPGGEGVAQPNTNVVNPVPPLPIAGKSPVEFFRELLAMTPTERRDALTNRAPENRKLIFAKIRAYESLKPDQRELRLQATELRWYLLPLLNLPATNRAAALALVPTNFYPLVTARLAVWDNLPPADQATLLKNEALIRYLTEVADQTEVELSPERRRMLEAGVPEWQSLTEEQRQNSIDRFNQFFSLTSEEKSKALNTISDAERRQIEKTLDTFGKLTAAQRAQCIRSLEKFTNLTVEERQQFLKNAERWKLMSPDERAAWRDLVTKLQLQPPMPPGFGAPPIPQAPPRKHIAGPDGG